MRDQVVSVPSYGRVHVGARCGVDARIAPPFMEATDASRLVCVVVVSYQEYSLTCPSSSPLSEALPSLMTAVFGLFNFVQNA